MNNNYKQAEKLNSDFYNKSCDKFGDIGWKACHYYDEFMQTVYYHSMFKYMPANTKSLLDVGCGQGDLLGFLKERKINLDYKGIDVSKNMVKKAQKKHGNNFFENISLLDLNNNELNYDVALCAGLFSLKVFERKQQLEYVEKSIEKLYSICNNSCSFTLLSKHGYEQVKNEKDLFYYEPWDIIKFCFNLTSCVILDHASTPIEFIVTLYKN